MRFVEEKILDDFDTIVNKYIVFLVHVQKSVLLQISKKIEIFDAAKKIASEIKLYVNRTLGNVNEFNLEEKKSYIKEILLKLGSDIVCEINKNKIVKINDETLFSLNTIIENITTDTNGIKMSRMDISNIYSYKELNEDKTKQKNEDENLKKIKDKIKTELDEIKEKAFMGMLYRKNENPKRFYEVNNFIIKKCKDEKIVFYVSDMPKDELEGLFFIINKNDLIIRRNKSGGLIVYTIKFSDFEERFNINITGKITVNAAETFCIDETYPNSMRTQVLNAYNIKEIIQLFNELYKKHISKNNESVKDNSIDEYLKGDVEN